MPAATTLLPFERERLEEEHSAHAISSLPYPLLRELYPDILIIPEEIRSYILASPQSNLVGRFVYQVLEQGKRSWSRTWGTPPELEEVRVFRDKGSLLSEYIDIWEMLERKFSHNTDDIWSKQNYERLYKTYTEIKKVNQLLTSSMPNPLGISLVNHENRCIIGTILLTLEPEAPGDDSAIPELYTRLHEVNQSTHEFLHEMEEYSAEIRQEWAMQTKREA